jgi:arsenic resistance protein ArsH
MKPSYYDRIVDVMEELMKFTLLTRGRSDYHRPLQRKERGFSERVNQRSI